MLELPHCYLFQALGLDLYLFGVLIASLASVLVPLLVGVLVAIRTDPLLTTLAIAIMLPIAKV